MKPSDKITHKGKGGQQESVDFRTQLASHTGGDVHNRRANKYGKQEEVSKETLREIFDL